MHVLPEGRRCYGQCEINTMLRACVDAILAQPVLPDVVLATGDLVQAGVRENYRCLREILAALPMPCYAVAGNHDDRDEFKRAFADHPTICPGQPHRERGTVPRAVSILCLNLPAAATP